MKASRKKGTGNKNFQENRPSTIYQIYIIVKQNKTLAKVMLQNLPKLVSTIVMKLQMILVLWDIHGYSPDLTLFTTFHDGPATVVSRSSSVNISYEICPVSIMCYLCLALLINSIQDIRGLWEKNPKEWNYVPTIFGCQSMLLTLEQLVNNGNTSSNELLYFHHP